MSGIGSARHEIARQMVNNSYETGSAVADGNGS
jgi:hypothetical protein